MTLPAGPYLDGDGHLVLKATRSDGRWTSGRMESTRDDFAAPAGGELEMTASKVRETITEARVGATAWKKAIDHGFFILLDLAIGGTYPDVMCKCATPAARATATGAMTQRWSNP